MLINNTFRSNLFFLCGFLFFLANQVYTMDYARAAWGMAQKGAGNIREMITGTQEQKPTISEELRKQKILAEAAEDIEESFKALPQAINSPIAGPAKEETIRNSIKAIRKNGIIPDTSDTRSAILDLLLEAAKPKFFRVVVHENGVKAILSAAKQIKDFMDPELYGGFQKVDSTKENRGETKESADKDEITAEDTAKLAASENMFGEEKSALEVTLTGLQALLRASIREENVQRVAIIRRWPDTQAQSAALGLLAAYDLERGFFEAYKDTKEKDEAKRDVYAQSAPVFNALTRLGQHLPEKVYEHAQIMYKVSDVGDISSKNIRKFATDGNGDILYGFCKNYTTKAVKEGVSFDLTKMCQFVARDKELFEGITIEMPEEKPAKPQDVRLGEQILGKKEGDIKLLGAEPHVTQEVPNLAESFSIPSSTAKVALAKISTAASAPAISTTPAAISPVASASQPTVVPDLLIEEPVGVPSPTSTAETPSTLTITTTPAPSTASSTNMLVLQSVEEKRKERDDERVQFEKLKREYEEEQEKKKRELVAPKPLTEAVQPAAQPQTAIAPVPATPKPAPVPHLPVFGALHLAKA